MAIKQHSRSNIEYGRANDETGRDLALTPEVIENLVQIYGEDARDPELAYSLLAHEIVAVDHKGAFEKLAR